MRLPRRSWRSFSLMVQRVVANVTRGLAMGAADVVPGVSGGTIALLLGIYDRLVGQIALLSTVAGQLLRGRLRQALTTARGAEWAFVTSLGVGIATAVLGLVELVRIGIDRQPVAMSAGFFGLVAMTVVTTRREVTQWHLGLAVLATGVASAVFVLGGLRAGSVADPAPAALIGAGALGVCAMILPGISGAFILLLLGMYDPVTEAVSDQDLGSVALLGLGAMIGLGVFSRLLQHLLERHRDTVVAVLIGLMAGSLRVLWPWPVGEPEAEGFGSAALGAPVVADAPAAVVTATAAAVVAWVLHRLGASRAAS